MAYRKLGRTSSQRKAMLRDLTTDLLINESIVTTEARAKEIRKTVEKMITLGKRGDLHARRQAAAYVRNEIASENYDEATDKYSAQTALQKLIKDIKRQAFSFRNFKNFKTKILIALNMQRERTNLILSRC